MDHIQISELSALIYKNLNSNFNSRKKENIINKYFSIYFNISSKDILLNKKIAWANSDLNRLKNQIHRINKGIPIQYVFEKEFFYNYLFSVDNTVLIPRPETEELVSKVIKREKHISNLKILEVGSGSGCISITLQKELLNPSIIAIDVSKEATKTAKNNARLLDAEISVKCVDFFDYNTSKKFDIIISNPPYIPIKDKNLVDKSVLKYEPKNALFVKNDPLMHYKKILKFSLSHLKKNGRIYFEINSLYKHDFEKHLKSYFSNSEYNFLKDLQGKHRFLFLKF